MAWGLRYPACFNGRLDDRLFQSMTSPIEKLTHELSKLPGIGGKTALRLVLHILRQPREYADNLSQSLQQVAQTVMFCSRCFHFTDINPCSLCQNPNRLDSTLCVVEESSDLLAIERTTTFRGRYHVLQGSLSPLDGVGPDQLRIRELLHRLEHWAPSEIILATNPSVSGDATALYLSKLIKPLGITVSRLAGGLPVGGHIEFTDPLTLSKAIQARLAF